METMDASEARVTRFLWLCAGMIAAWMLMVGFVYVAVRVAGGPHAWKVGLLIIAALPLVGFATRERQ